VSNRAGFNRGQHTTQWLPQRSSSLLVSHRIGISCSHSYHRRVARLSAWNGVYTEVMLRRAIAALLTVALAVLVTPCNARARTQGESHACCASQAQVTSLDCCGAAMPHPATAPEQGQCAPASSKSAAHFLVHFSREIEVPVVFAAAAECCIRIPATILRT
jgi:hypothetical protein